MANPNANKSVWLLLNVKGARSDKKLGVLRDLLKQHRTDFGILTETNSDPSLEQNWRNIFQDYNIFFSHTIEHNRSGIAVLIKKPYTATIVNESEGRYIHVKKSPCT